MTTLSIAVSGQPYSALCSDQAYAKLETYRLQDMDNLVPGEDQDAETPVADRPGYRADVQAYVEAMVIRSDQPPQEVLERVIANASDPVVPNNDVPQDAPTYNGVPAFVSNYQAREALRQAGLFPTINTSIKSLGEDSSEFQAWEYANNFYRNSTLIATMATVLGVDEATIDNLFTKAAQIN